MRFLLNSLKRANTSYEGDTLEVNGVEILDASRQAVKTGPLTAASFTDANGAVQNRRYTYLPAEIDLSGATATIVGPVMPQAAQIAKAWYIVSEAIGADANTTKLQLGTIDADGSSNGDADAHVLGTTDAANGLVTAKAAVGTVVELTLGGADAGAIAAGKCLTVTHTQDADLAGKLKVLVEYYFT